MNGIIALNLPYSPKPYDESVLKTINTWVDFFIDNNITVIATPPMERTDVGNQIGAATHQKFRFHPVTSFDTCDRWRSGLTAALDLSQGPFFLWSADFKFTDESERAAISLLTTSVEADLIVGTIQAEGSKEAIDECATKPLIRSWFADYWPSFVTGRFAKPRSELLRFDEAFLRQALARRWYPTEQTINLLLQCFDEGFKAVALPFDHLEDAPEARDNPNIVEQVDRMELWLKYMWRERHRSRIVREYAPLCRNSALIVEEAYSTLLATMHDDF